MGEREEQRPGSPLESERGSTTIQDGVVSTIAGLAAREVEGVDIGGGASRAAGGVLERVTGSQVLSRGISVEVGKIETAIEITIASEYGRNIHQLAEKVRSKITERVESLTGLRIVELNVTVGDIIFPEEKGRLGKPESRLRQARQAVGFEADDDREREIVGSEPADASTRPLLQTESESG
ncbi:MAG: Asp23/Gls24 family envelope stress response protein, partial [Rubrobacter sp.]|nr:Asp23/Gls24 family envelope stress response protein [Rubrobacter sp.]